MCETFHVAFANMNPGEPFPGGARGAVFVVRARPDSPTAIRDGLCRLLLLGTPHERQED